jgi:predicted DNA-binding transcriptional regulator YafY
MFVLDRIKMLKVTDERFTVPKDFHLDDFMRHSFKVMHDELYTAKVRISPGWARWVGEKIWHESQKIARLPDGSLEVSFQVAGLDEIKRWILSLGPEVIVLEPTQLRNMIKGELADSLSFYKGDRNLEKYVKAQYLRSGA